MTRAPENMVAFYKDYPGTAMYHTLDALEYVAFIVPRMIQNLLDMPFGMGLISGSMAMNLYLLLSYGTAAVLLFMAHLQARQCIWSGELVICKETFKPLLMGMIMTILAIYTVMAPTTGLSLRHCTMSAAPFVTFNQ